MNAPPDLVHGAWTRRSVSIEDGPHFETQHVIWLQAGRTYADMRVPFHPAAERRCFTGRSGWDGDQYRWTHTLDLEGPDSPAADDIADLVWENDVLVERGMFPTTSGATRYVEVWERLPGDDGEWTARESTEECYVRVGSHAMQVAVRGGRVAACYQILEAGRWRQALTL